MIGERCEEVAAVVITFNPDVETLHRALSALISQVGSIVVVDNHSVSAIDASRFDDGIECIRLETNRGIAAGHNIGIDWARRRGAQYVLLMDQDSIPQVGMVRELLAVHETVAREGRYVAGVGCRYSEGAQGKMSDFVQFGSISFKRVVNNPSLRYVEADFLISSGTMISLATLNAVGLMEEDLFIDHVDTEWFLRARAKGYKAYGAMRAVMEHSLGERRTKLWFMRWRVVPHHAPIRYYYIFRNSMLLLRRDYVTEQWRRGAILRLILTGLYFCCTLSGWERIRMMRRGLRDGLRGVVGQYGG